MEEWENDNKTSSRGEREMGELYRGKQGKCHKVEGERKRDRVQKLEREIVVFQNDVGLKMGSRWLLISSCPSSHKCIVYNS